jgi:hypothetical protein
MIHNGQRQELHSDEGKAHSYKISARISAVNSRQSKELGPHRRNTAGRSGATEVGSNKGGEQQLTGHQIPDRSENRGKRRVQRAEDRG